MYSSRTIESLSATLPLLSVCCFGTAFELCEPRGPERLEKPAELGERLRANSIVPAGAVLAFVDQPGFAEHAYVLRYVRTRDAGEMGGELAGRELAFEQQP